jgi:hypothetical protein
VPLKEYRHGREMGFARYIPFRHDDWVGKTQLLGTSRLNFVVNKALALSPFRHGICCPSRHIPLPPVGRSHKVRHRHWNKYSSRLPRPVVR